MTAPHTAPMTTKLLNCRLCNKPPGTKVGPPALARCLTDGCEARALGAETHDAWNKRNSQAPMGEQELIALADRIESHLEWLANEPMRNLNMTFDDWNSFSNDFLDAAKALRAAAAPRLAGREEIARIIDPHAWQVAATADMRTEDVADWKEYAGKVRAPLLAKADAILSLLGPAPSESVGWQPIESKSDAR